MLLDLHDIAIASRQRFRDEFTANEVILSDAFKETYGASLRRDRQDVDFTAHTAVVTTAGNLKMYIPNQWFCAAAYTTQFIQVFLQYKRLLDDLLTVNYPSTNDKKEYIKTLKETQDANAIEAFKNSLLTLLPNHVSPAEVEETANLLVRFATDYEWWFGSKTIDRGDSYVSPVLALLGVVNVSQGYIADISYKYATEQSLADVALQMIETNPREPEHDEEAETLIPVPELQRLTGGVNEIVYGAPGTGKSRYLEDEYAHTTRSIRVVFHPEYTVFDFVGTYKPVPLYHEQDAPLYTIDGEPVDTGEPVIDYRFVPGPFLSCLVDAWLDPAHMYTLLIEEINRSNTAAVFGEVFQLLDRDINGTSEYNIVPSNDVRKYLLSINGMRQFVENGVRIPSNMNIVATMNSADQGVMPMDSAFKRRWSFKYIRINIAGAVHEMAPMRYAGLEVAWGNLVRAINVKLTGMGLDEDRLIGPYFIKPDELGRRSATDKLLLYLWDDVLRHTRDAFFNNRITTFADLSDKFSEDDVFDLLNSPQAVLLVGEPPVVTIDDNDTDEENEQ